MTPMIDVVFLLIIFFLVSSHLARQEAQLPLPLPVADEGRLTTEEEPPRVTINVLGDGQLTLAGRTVTHAELEQRLAIERERAGEALQVRIRGDRDVPYEFIGPILTACSQAGIHDATFAVYHREDAG